MPRMLLIPWGVVLSVWCCEKRKRPSEISFPFRNDISLVLQSIVWADLRLHAGHAPHGVDRRSVLREAAVDDHAGGVGAPPPLRADGVRVVPGPEVGF